MHTGYYGTTTTATGAYYHQPGVANYYGATGCYNCGAGAGWAAAAGVATGVAVGATATAAAMAARPVATAPAMYSVLPAGCIYQAGYYACNGTWLRPAYGANGVYYSVVPPP
jgi:hypothetical protein